MIEEPPSPPANNPPAIPTVSHWKVAGPPDEGANYVIDLYWFERTQKRAWIARRILEGREERIADDFDGGSEMDCLAAAEMAINVFRASLAIVA